MPAQTSLKAAERVVGRLEEVHDLVAQVRNSLIARRHPSRLGASRHR